MVQTTVAVAKTGTRSLKVTIPEALVMYLELEKGDKLEWKMDVDKKNGNRVATVWKAKE